MKLVAPSGEELLIDNNFGGYAGATLEHAFVLASWEQWLHQEGNSIPTHKFLALAGSQALLNSAFMKFHSYRLTWGDTNPEESHACYPNGVDLKWSIYWCANGLQRLKLSGSLPAGWWEMDRDKRQKVLKSMLIQWECIKSQF